MKKYYLSTSWKMNLSVQSGLGYVKKLIDFEGTLGKIADGFEVVVFPDFLSIYTVACMLNDSNIKVGAQDCFWETRGAYTGEISPLFLKEAGCDYVLLGHPERIINLGEKPQIMARKLKVAVNNGLDVFLIIYEKPDVRKNDVLKQLIDDLMVFIGGLRTEEIKKVVLIYEPLWAIGTDKVAATDHIRDVAAGIREFLGDEFGKEVENTVPIKYGGGVTKATSKDIIAIKELDGLGMGRAGLDISFFTSTMKYINDMLLEKTRNKGR